MRSTTVMNKRAQHASDVRVLLFQNKSNKEGLVARLQSTAGTSETVQLERDVNAYAPYEEFCKRKAKLSEDEQSGDGSSQGSCDVANAVMKHNDAKETRQLQQHRATWAFEWSQMERTADSIATDLSEILAEWQDDEEELSELAECQRIALLDEDEFVEKTVQPVLTLRDDVAFWLSAFEMQENYGQGDSNDVLSLIASVKGQQSSVMAQLQQELQKMETALECESGEKKVPCTLQGIPPTLSLDLCPTEEFRNELVEEFLLLDIKYQQKLVTVQERFMDVIRSLNNGWSKDDHNLFVHGSNFYSPTFPRYQELTYDYLLRLLPQHSLDQLLMHSYWVTRQRQYCRTVSATISDWGRCKEELLNKVNAAIDTACRHLLEEADNVVKQVSQQTICEKLSEKVVQWRKEKFANMQLEDERENEAYLKLKRQQYAEELQRRAAVKEQIMEYHKELEAKQQEEMAMQSKKMEMLHKRKEYEARYNKTRVQYRQFNREIVMQQNKEKQLSKENEAKKRQQKLDALRRLVAVEAVRDPLRMMQATSAYEAKRKHVFDAGEEIPIMKPLYEVYSFNDKQLSADLRVHLEAKLREAGLLHLPYAQDALRQLPPPTMPRPDMKSTIRFGDS